MNLLIHIKMRFLVIALFLLAGALADEADNPGYTTLRFTVKKELIHGSHLEALAESAKALAGIPWAGMHEEYGSGAFKLSYTVSNVKLASGTYDPKKLTTNVFKVLEKQFELTQAGPAMALDFSFDYDFVILGMHLFFGKGHAVMNLVGTYLKETFTEREIKVSMGTSWSATYTVSGSNLFDGMTAWASRLFSLHHFKEVDTHLAILYSKIMHEGVKAWSDQKVVFYENQALNLLLANNLVSMNESPADYITIAYQTDMTVEDRPLAKSTYKYLHTPVIMNGEKCKVCVATGYLPNMAELQAKAKDFLIALDPKKQLGLSGKIKDLGSVMPIIYEMVDSELEMYVGCRNLADNNILRIRRDSEVPEKTYVQIPANCVFGIRDLAMDMLSVNIFIRAEIVKMHSATPEGFTMKGVLKNPTLYNLRVSSAAFPVANIDNMFYIANRIVKLLEGFPVIAPGFSVPVKVGATSVNSVLGVDEDCFTFA